MSLFIEKQAELLESLSTKFPNVNIFNENLENSTKCFYPSYSLMVEWNGDIFLCPQDWQRRVTMGNVMQETIFEIWTGKIITKFRKNLLSGKRCSSPCSSCNADGTLLGKNHAKKWKDIYSINTLNKELRLLKQN